MNDVTQFTEDERYIRLETRELWTGKQVKAHMDILFDKEKAVPVTVEPNLLMIRLRSGKECFYKRTR